MGKPATEIQLDSYHTQKKDKPKPGGTNTGFFVTHDYTNQEYFFKWFRDDLVHMEDYFKKSDIKKGRYQKRNYNRLKNEYLATKIYALYNVNVPNIEFVTFLQKNIRCYGILSEVVDDIKPLNSLAIESKDKNEWKISNQPLFEEICKKTQEDFLIDVLLSNYDVIGTELDNLHFETKTNQPLRLDQGGALLYYARGKPKKGGFNPEVNELEDMASGLNRKTGFNKGAISQAGKVFQGVNDSPELLISLRKLISINDAQLKECIKENGFDNGKLRNKGRRKDKQLLENLIQRKRTLVLKAEEIILNRLKISLKTSSERADYLSKAGINKKSIETICNEINKNKENTTDLRNLIRYAILPIDQESKQKRLNIELVNPPDSHVLDKLLNLCNKYKSHLQTAITNDPSNLADQKYTIVQNMIYALTDDAVIGNNLKIKNMEKILTENNCSLLERRRNSSVGAKFLEGVLHVLSFGMYAKHSKGMFSFWSHGKAFTDQTAKILKPPAPK